MGHRVGLLAEENNPAGLIPVSIRFVLTFVLFLGVASGRSLAVEADSTLLLYDTADANSVSIKDHYLAVHPGVRALGLTLPSFGEQILAQEYLDTIRQPVLDHLNSAGLNSIIDTFVTTKGLPLRIDAGSDPNPGPLSNWRQFSSLESELTRIDTIGSVAEMGDQNFSNAVLNVPGVKPANPYYLGLEFDLFTGETLPYDGPEGFDRSDPINENIRLASRLDGYTQQDVIDMIDRAQSAFLVPFGHAIIVDGHPASPVFAETAMPELAQSILPSHDQLAIYDETNSPILSSPSPVIGYVGHGVHSGLPGGVPGELDETGYIFESLDFEYANGAIFHTYESFNAISFDLTNTSGAISQGQVAQWIAAGGTAGLGHVYEPTANVSTVTNEDIFFDMMLSGYTLAEAAWAATRQLSFVNTVVGDPLMRWKTWIPGDANLDGLIDNADAGILLGNWGDTTLGIDGGDFNSDGWTNAKDGGILFENWTFSQSASLRAVAAPEPSSVWIAISGLCGLLAARRRSTSRI